MWRGLREDYRPRRVINLCRGSSIDCSPSVSQSLVIKDVTGQFGVAGGGRPGFNRLHAEVCVCHQAGKLSSFHRERRYRPQAGEEGGMHRWQEGEGMWKMRRAGCYAASAPDRLENHLSHPVRSLQITADPFSSIVLRNGLP